MKYLNDYIDDAMSKVFDETGAFFCFGQKQFNEKKKDGVKYVSLGAGLVCPKETHKGLWEKISDIQKEGRKKDLKENKRRGIVIRELDNHDAFYTGDIEPVVKALEPYGIGEKYIREVYITERETREAE